MASRSSRARRSRRASTDTTPRRPTGPTTPAKRWDKTVSHLTHHRMIARNLNALRENFGELRKQVVETEREYKRGDKGLDSALFQTRNQLEAMDKHLGDLETRLVDFIEEMTEVAFNSNSRFAAIPTASRPSGRPWKRWRPIRRKSRVGARSARSVKRRGRMKSTGRLQDLAEKLRAQRGGHTRAAQGGSLGLKAKERPLMRRISPIPEDIDLDMGDAASPDGQDLRMLG